MQRYDTYKDSGVYFLPDLPANWEIRKAKYLFKEENRPVKPDDEIVTCFRDGQVTLRKNRRVEGFTNSLKEIGYQGVRKGDLVIHNMDAFAGSIGISDSDGKATPVYSCCTPKSSEVNQFYYCYLLRFLARNGFILSLAKGIRERSTDFRFNDFKELYLPVPSREEQDAIVKHIDTATAKIDAAIAQQQKMIDLLNERKQIIINRAVTKGLNPNARMKDSGVEWIGDVPEHWEVKKLGFCIDILPGYAFSSQDFVENGIKLLRGINVTPEKLRWEDTVFWNKAIDESLNKYLLEENDLVLGLDRPWIGSGTRAVLVKEEDLPCLLVQRVCRIRPTNRMSIKYIYYLLSNKLFYNALAVDTTGVSVPHISTEQIKKVVMPIPDLSEQNSIVEYIEVHVASINKAIQAVNNQISLLQERKQIVINEVVTGKVKVM